ncbi:MAG: hypothetical protein H7338_14435 [Candidatus Sericytochromatia bacterium]|nr:hypothetical protein [Candidatus Sericytochromatia bacterium]
MARIRQTGDMAPVTIFPQQPGMQSGTTASLPQTQRQAGKRRLWPSPSSSSSFQLISALGKPSVWVRKDVLDFAMIALGPSRMETIVAAMPIDAAIEDRWVTMADSEMIRDRSVTFVRMADSLYPTGETQAPLQRLSRQAPDRAAQTKLEHDPAYDLSDMDEAGLMRTYRIFCRQPHHPVTLACVRELARRQSSLAC